MLHHAFSSPMLFRLALWLAEQRSVRDLDEHQRLPFPGRRNAALLLAVRPLDRTPSTATSLKSPRPNASCTNTTPPRRKQSPLM